MVSICCILTCVCWAPVGPQDIKHKRTNERTNERITFAGGDLSLGCWTATGQADSCQPSGKGPSGSPGKEPQHSIPAVPSDMAQQAGETASSGDMDLTHYFATLPNEVVPFRELISPVSPLLLKSAWSRCLSAEHDGWWWYEAHIGIDCLPETVQFVLRV